MEHYTASSNWSSRQQYPEDVIYGEQYPLREQFLTLHQQDLRRRALLQQQQSSAGHLPSHTVSRRMSMPSQPMNTLPNDLRRALPVHAHSFSASPPSSNLFTGEPSSLASRISSRSSQPDSRTTQSRPDRYPTRYVASFGRSVPMRSMTEQPRPSYPSEMSTSLHSRGMALPDGTSPSQSSGSTNPLFGAHPSGDPSYYAKAPPQRRKSDSMVQPRSSYSARKGGAQLSKIDEPSDSEAETSSSLSTSSESATESSESSSEPKKSRKKAKGKGKSRKKAKGRSSSSKTKREKKRSSRPSLSDSAYGVLGVSQNASQRSIRQVYRAVIDKLEEKLGRASSSEVMAAIMEKVMEIKKAYAVLGDEKIRAKYDRYLDGSSPSSSEDEGASKKHGPVAKSSHYDLIGLQPDATVEDIKKAAQDLINWHYTRMENAQTEEDYLAAKRSEDAIQRVWKTLSVPEDRERYDKKLKYGSDFKEDNDNDASAPAEDKAAQLPSSQPQSPKTKKEDKTEEASAKSPQKSGRSRSSTDFHPKDRKDRSSRKGKERSKRD